MIAADTKVCARCEAEKPRGEFHAGRRYKDGLQTWCRTCKVARQRELRNADPSKTAEKVRQDRRRHPARFATYDKKRPERGHEYRARKTGAFVERVQKRKVYERDEGLCGICSTHVVEDDMHLDHVIPLSRGGQHSYGNVQTAHSVCNLRKWAKLPTEYLAESSQAGR